MIKKVFALATVVLFATAGVAAAQDYPPGGPSITANTTTVGPGGSLTVSAEPFQGDVDFTLFSKAVKLGTATADANGVATLTATIPTSTPSGSHRIEATGTGLDGAPLTVSLAITVTGAGGAGLPRTGSSSTVPMGQIALAAIAGGGLLILVANKRRSAKADTDDREMADL